MLFGGLRLKGKWGLSSDNVVLNKKYYEWIIKQGGSILFSPTFSTFNPLNETKRLYAKLVIGKLNAYEYVIYSRPLSFNIENIKNIINLTRDVPLIASIYGRTFAEWETLVEFCEKRGFDALEIDLSLENVLSESNYPLADLISEIASITRLPLFLKVPIVGGRYNIYRETSDVRGIILSPHITYSIGSHIFRIHSTELSTLILSMALSIISELEGTISVAMISDTFIKNRYNYNYVIEHLNLILYDTSLLLRYLGISKKFEIRSLKPVFAWPSISRNMKLAFDSEKMTICQTVCPYGSIPSKGKGLVEVSDTCDFCGLCLSLCNDLIKIVKIFKP